ncbi:TetR/AcrR family transcriptional regulator [Sphingomonas alpina]|uniref:TetR/AcrR family transcriptional regulator n=1 Tax=Sphingomonas alpina TaxID=653931 RepID=UPI001E3438F2|nr:TetR/AcrR family transcriptional regulator [Sphingomonas alpina]
MNLVDLVAKEPKGAEIRRRKILDCARALFIDHGFHATGVAQISAMSGVAVGQIYRDFASKEDIVVSIVQDDCVSFMDAETLRDAIDHRDKPGVREWLRHFVNPQDERGDEDGARLFAEIIAESARNERIASIFTTIHDDVRGKTLDALEVLSEGKDEVPAREVVADLIATMSLGLMHHRMMRRDLAMEPLVEALERIIDREIEALRSGHQ